MLAKYIIALSSLILFLNNSIAQTKSESSKVTFITKDNITINAYYAVPENKTVLSPAIIFIHQGGSSHKEWLKLPLTKRLFNEGYAILAYDIRQHGKSEKDKGTLFNLFNNPKRAPLDLRAAIDFLENDKHIDKTRIGVIGGSIGGNLVCVATSSSIYNIKSGVSISLKTKAAQNLSNSKKPIEPKNVFYISSENDQGGLRKKWAHELYNKTSGERKIVITKGSLHGSSILKKDPALANAVIAWFKKTL